MRLTLWGIPVLLAASLLALKTTTTTEIAFADDAWWMSDYQAALRRSEATGKPILLEFR